MAGGSHRRDKVSLSCHLDKEGWLKVTLSNGPDDFTIFPSHLWDCLSDLVAATVNLLSGNDYAICRWMDEPGEYRWRLDRRDEKVRISVLRLAESRSGRVGPAGELVFVAECPVRRFALQVHNQFWQLLEKHGSEEYQRLWQRSFPHVDYERLGQLIAEGGAARER